MTWKKLFPIFLLIVLLAACGAVDTQSSTAPAYYDYGDGGAVMEEAMPMEAPASDADVYGRNTIVDGVTNVAYDQTAATSGEAQTQERLIIRTADMSIVVEDTDETIAAITRMAEENEGWVVTSGVYQYNETAKTGNITIRIPSEGFNSAIAAIRGLSLEVTSESSSGQDVTEEYVDLNARLENLEATADRVRSFLDDATKVEDALAVNAELSRLEGEIEVIKGRMQYLSQSASFSTININITPDVLSQPIEVGGWRAEGVVRDALESLVEALQGLATLVIWFVLVALPLGLIIIVPLWIIWRVVRGRRSRVSPPVAGAQ